MLTRIVKTLLCVMIALSYTGCEDDAIEVSSEPSLKLGNVVASLPGETFAVQGLISDAAGISNVSLEYSEWSLAKTIAVDQSVTQFELNYAFKVPDDAEEGSTHIIKVTATNVGGKASTMDVEVTLSLDNVAPQITFNSPNDGGTYIVGAGPEFTLSFDVTDAAQVASVNIVGLGFNESIEVGAASYSFSEEIDFSIAGAFQVTVTATDNSGNSSTSVLSVSIEESLKFDRMYLADVSTDAGLTSDIFGVPLRINGFAQVDSAGIVFEALYYNQAAGTEVRFIPQKSSFAPFAFGRGANPGEIAIGNDATVDPIVLPDVGYYRIYINLGQLSYSMETYEPSDTPFDQIYLIGTGVRVNGESTCINNNDASETCWNFASGKPLDVDGDNPYLFTGTVELFDHDLDGEGNNGFILGANPSGWSPFWRFDQGDVLDLEPESTVPNGGGNFIFSEAKYGTYHFEFDTHLNRVKMVPQ